MPRIVSFAVVLITLCCVVGAQNEFPDLTEDDVNICITSATCLRAIADEYDLLATRTNHEGFRIRARELRAEAERIESLGGGAVG